MNRFLASSVGITVRDAITIDPDDTVISGIVAKDTGLSAERLPVPKLRIRKLNKEEQLNVTPCGRAAGERSGRGNIGPLILDTAPMTVIHRMSKNKEA